MRTDGTKYIQEALDRGAKTIVTEDSSVKVPGSVAKVCVDDVRRTLNLPKDIMGIPMNT